MSYLPDGLCVRMGAALRDRNDVEGQRKLADLWFTESNTLAPALCNVCPKRGECALDNLNVYHGQMGAPQNGRKRVRAMIRQGQPKPTVEEMADLAYGFNERAIHRRRGSINGEIERAYEEARVYASTVIPGGVDAVAV